MNAPSPPRPVTREAEIAQSGGSIHDFRKSTRKMRSWYESLADHMIVHPTISHSELARHFGRAESTISTVVNTDSFKMYFRQRRAAYEATLDAEVRRKLFRLADTSIDTMLTVLEKKKDSVPLESLQRVSDMALKNLGYGAEPPSGVTVNVGQPTPTVNIAVSLDDLERAREALRRNQLAAPPIDVEYTEIPKATEGSGATTSSVAPKASEASGAGSGDKPPLEDLA